MATLLLLMLKLIPTNINAKADTVVDSDGIYTYADTYTDVDGEVTIADAETSD